MLPIIWLSGKESRNSISPPVLIVEAATYLKIMKRTALAIPFLPVEAAFGHRASSDALKPG